MVKFSIYLKRRVFVMDKQVLKLYNEDNVLDDDDDDDDDECKFFFVFFLTSGSLLLLE